MSGIGRIKGLLSWTRDPTAGLCRDARAHRPYRARRHEQRHGGRRGDHRRDLRSEDIPIPFDPYLAAVGWLAMLWGDFLKERYLDLLT